MTCPKCGNVEVRWHGSLQRMEWVKRRPWSWLAPRGVILAVELSCGKCAYAFVARPDGSWEPAPIQAAYDLLRDAQARVVEAGKGPSPDKEATREPKPMARPAPDPRVRKR